MDAVHTPIDMRARQKPLRARFRERPADATVTDVARTVPHASTDVLHGTVIPGNRDDATPVRYGVHWAVGGLHDLPVPGDLLCAALAACAESTLRIVASRMGLLLDHLSCSVTADVDVRGTLAVDPTVDVGFQRVTVHVDLRAPTAPPEAVRKLLAAAEHSCVVLRTLRHGVTVDFRA
jgi:uncharacterized OsmC-like protein